MKMDDYKKKIMDLINGIEDTPTLRKIYLILIAITGADQ